MDVIAAPTLFDATPTRVSVELRLKGWKGMERVGIAELMWRTDTHTHTHTHTPTSISEKYADVRGEVIAASCRIENACDACVLKKQPLRKQQK